MGVSLMIAGGGALIVVSFMLGYLLGYKQCFNNLNILFNLYVKQLGWQDGQDFKNMINGFNDWFVAQKNGITKAVKKE